MGALINAEELFLAVRELAELGADNRQAINQGTNIILMDDYRQRLAVEACEPD